MPTPQVQREAPVTCLETKEDSPWFNKSNSNHKSSQLDSLTRMLFLLPNSLLRHKLSKSSLLLTLISTLWRILPMRFRREADRIMLWLHKFYKMVSCRRRPSRDSRDLNNSIKAWKCRALVEDWVRTSLIWIVLQLWIYNWAVKWVKWQINMETLSRLFQDL